MNFLLNPVPHPLAIQKDGTWFTYGYDITKNVCELFGPNGYIRTAYSYTPFGSVSASENGVVQNFQWSSEFYDSELDLVYYNYRHYSPSLGRFLSRDPIAEQGGLNLYAFVRNRLFIIFDRKGLLAQRITISANQVPVEPGNVRIGFLAKFEKGRLSVSLHLKEGLNFSGRLIAEGESVGMRIVYDERAFSKESFLADEAYLHEKTHFENYKKEYNALVEEFNSYDGKKFTYWGRFCGDCSDKLSSYVVARTALFREKCRVADLILEYNDYSPEQLQYYYNNVLKTGHKISDRGYSELDSTYAERVREAFGGAISDAQENVKKLEEKVSVLKRDLDTCF